MSARKFGASWWADFTCQRKRHRIKSPDNSHAGARNFERMVRQRLARGEPVTGVPEPVSITFADFAKDWMERYVKVNNKPSEQRMKECILRLHLLPHFGSLPLDGIGSSHVEGYKAAKLAEGLSPKTINNTLTVLTKCLRTAIEWELPARCPRPRLFKVTSERIDFLTPAESHQLLAACSVPSERAMFLLALRTGIRAGELIGLRWQSVDVDRKEVTIERSIVRGIVGAPKNGKSRRIPITTEVAASLATLDRVSELVFCRSDGNSLTHRMVYAALHRGCKRAGLRLIGVHTLRHTFASQLACEGVSLAAIKDLLGHSSIAMTMRYAHLSPAVLREAVAVLEQAERRAVDSGQPAGNGSAPMVTPMMYTGHLAISVSALNPHKNSGAAHGAPDRSSWSG